MSDKRNNRKRPNRLQISPDVSIELTASLHSDEYIVQLYDKGSTCEIYLTRAGARDARDWLNHFIEFVAQQGES